MSAASATSGLHVYCVVREDTPPPDALEGLYGRPVASWAASGLRAWASALVEPPPPDPRLLERHHDVVMAAFRTSGVLPVRFGQWLSDQDALLGWLEREGDDMRRTLERLGAAVEFGVRLGAPSTSLEAVAPAEGLRRGAGRGEGTPAPAEPSDPRKYLRTIARSRAVRREALSRRDALVGRLATAVGPMILDQRVLGASPGDLAAVAHLVDRARVDSYREAVVRFLERQAPGVAELTGPWPPWSFVA